ncbi:hypothetical protein B0T10DRAFT_455007 [Thelonectria olida]|uniref:Uncharacterized protein n=1 Tax=Thelonectria olida TaxID=1576542 RepID=A0A9P8WCK2_9HYPO|nr:hypothetical protein B0T10DRAFT_455007 [Thelonectria olida]
MSKQSESVNNDDLPPPPYSYSSPSTTTTNPSYSAQFVSSVLSSHLNGLPARISYARAAQTSERIDRDGEILSLLIPHIEDLIQTLTTMKPPPSRLEMTMVPGDAVGEDWSFSDEHRMRRLVKIYEPNKGQDVKEKEKPAPRYDEWTSWEDDNASSSSTALWWQDDTMASRLARYLQPERPKPKSQPRPAEKPQKTKKGWGSFLKKNEPAPVYPPPEPRVEDEAVTFTVNAEEVTFRRENEMGIWESKTGWGLVVRIRIKQ